MDRQIMAPTSSPGAFLYSIAADLWSDDPLLIYVEQLQAGMLLTSLGLALPLVPFEGQRPLVEFFVVNGPGFATGVDVLFQWGRSEQQEGVPGAAPVATREQAFFSPNRYSGLEQGDPTTAGWVDRSALNHFNMGLERIFRPNHLQGLPGSARDSGSNAAARAILDRVFREGWQRVADVREQVLQVAAAGIENLSGALRRLFGSIGSAGTLDQPRPLPADCGDESQLEDSLPEAAAGPVGSLVIAALATGLWSSVAEQTSPSRALHRKNHRHAIY
jgi:hypothetical protein